MSAARPDDLCRWYALGLLLCTAFFAAPATVPSAPVAMILSMEVMHVVAWGVSVGLLTTLARQEASA